MAFYLKIKESIRVASQQFSQADASSKIDPSKTDANRSASIQAIKFIVADVSNSSKILYSIDRKIENKI
jgi:hypothetical protein